jgi:hypothetical protein
VHLFVELAATYGVQLKAPGALVTKAVLALETRARSTAREVGDRGRVIR